MIAAYIIVGAYVLFSALLTWERKSPTNSRPPADVPIGPPRK